TYIEPEVIIEQDVTIFPGSVITGESKIKTNAEIGPHSEIIDCEVGEETIIKQSVARNSKIGNRVSVGPFAHIRPEASVGNDAKVGNFVELKKASIGEKSKVPHLSYIGDADIGRNVNIGCGTITVNYDGKTKNLTTIEDNIFISCHIYNIIPLYKGTIYYDLYNKKKI